MSEIFFLSGNPKKKHDRKVYITGLIINCLVWTMAVVLIIHTAVEIIHHLNMAKIVNLDFLNSLQFKMLMPNKMPPPPRPIGAELPMPPPPPFFSHHNLAFLQKTMPLRILFLICHLLVGLGTLYILKNLTKGYQKRDFFSIAMVKRYVLLGVGLILLALISLAQSLLTFHAFNFADVAFSEQLFIVVLDLWFKPYGILTITGLHCLVLAIVMREGNRIFEEQSLTI